jgi:hypothetical protein
MRVSDWRKNFRQSLSSFGPVLMQRFTRNPPRILKQHSIQQPPLSHHNHPLKNIFEVERFSGTSITAIKQDVLGVLMLASLESVFGKYDQQVLETRAAENQTRYVPQINRAVSYVALVDRIVPLLASSRPQDEVLEELHHLFRQNPTLQRPNRQVARAPLKYAHRLRFHKYVKKLLA